MTTVNVFRALHERPPLVLPNAWDAGSAAAIESAGAAAIATTSAGVSWSGGTPDGQRLGRERVLRSLAGIVAVVDVPVTADIEGGYGDTSDELAATVRAVVDLGVAGVNIEDSPGVDGPLRDAADQAERIAVVRATAGAALWINARTDTFLAGGGSQDDRVRESLARAQAYAAAGADSLFVPGVVDLDLIRALAAGPLPLNVMAGPGAPDVAALAAAGAVRISVGSAIAEAAYGLAASAAHELLTAGTYTSMSGALDYGRLNELVR